MINIKYNINTINKGGGFQGEPLVLLRGRGFRGTVGSLS